MQTDFHEISVEAAVSAAMFVDLRATRPPLQQRKFRRGLGRPRIGLVIGGHDLLGVLVQKAAKPGDIKSVMARGEDRQVRFGKPK